MGSPRLTDAAARIDRAGSVHRPLLSVGVTTADWMRMGEALAILENGGADFLHIDVMDGCFCPQLTMGPPVISGLRTSLRKDLHLMIEDPLPKVGAYVDAGADTVTFHVEATRHPHRVLQALGNMRSAVDGKVKIRRGIALNPGTPVTAVEPLLEEAELVLVLAINPGWGGQRFGLGTARRLAAVRQMIDASGREVKLGVDGGVTRDNIASIAAMDVDLIVTGSAVFDGVDPAANMRQILTSIGRRTG